ncbi:MAG: aspartate kinase [Bacteroidales bacterium]|nr:aspartate kinase [Bacteroidales bacterium]
MIIFKFGGASVKNAQSVKNIAGIIRQAPGPLIAVVSAMGKTTNRLETILEKGINNSGEYKELMEELILDHLDLISKLIPDPTHPLFEEVRFLFLQAANMLKTYEGKEYNFIYDQVVSVGELVSTKIVSTWLEYSGISNHWVDIRQILKTDSSYREAIVNHEISASLCRNMFQASNPPCFITQGFIGSDMKNHTTTLGREGSDYTAALLADYLDAENVTLWKDVDGIFNADPARFSNVRKIDTMDYQEVIELTYYGAKVIHPKTIRPLFEKRIPLFVKNFNAPEKSGTAVGKTGFSENRDSFIIVLENQLLISVSKNDLSFISELNLSYLFDLLHSFRLKANLMQHSAVSFSFCVDTPKGKAVKELIVKLQKEFKVLYNTNLLLITVRNYSPELIHELIGNKNVLVEQRSRQTVQFVIA